MAIKGRARKEPPYEYMTGKKWDSLGQTLTLKRALNLWWNSIRFKTKKYGKLLAYKSYDGEYVFMTYVGSEELEDEEVEALLKSKIELDNDYYEDADGYPVVDGNLVEDF